MILQLFYRSLVNSNIMHTMIPLLQCKRIAIVVRLPPMSRAATPDISGPQSNTKHVTFVELSMTVLTRLAIKIEPFITLAGLGCSIY